MKKHRYDAIVAIVAALLLLIYLFKTEKEIRAAEEFMRTCSKTATEYHCAVTWRDMKRKEKGEQIE